MSTPDLAAPSSASPMAVTRRGKLGLAALVLLLAGAALSSNAVGGRVQGYLAGSMNPSHRGTFANRQAGAGPMSMQSYPDAVSRSNPYQRSVSTYQRGPHQDPMSNPYHGASYGRFDTPPEHASSEPLHPDASGFDRWRSHRFGGSSVFRQGGPLYDRSSNQYGSTYGEAPKHDENGAVVHDQEAAAKAAWLAKADAARGGGGAMSKDNQEQSGDASGWDRWRAHRFGGSNMQNRGGPLWGDHESIDGAPEKHYGDASGWDRWQSHRFGGSNVQNQGGALYDRSDKGSIDGAPEKHYGDASGWDRWQSSRLGGSNMQNHGGPLWGDHETIDGAPDKKYGDASGYDRWRAHRFGGSNVQTQGGPLYHRSDDQYGSTYGEAPKAAEESKEAQAA